jgi:hypothetical protein
VCHSEFVVLSFFFQFTTCNYILSLPVHTLLLAEQEGRRERETKEGGVVDRKGLFCFVLFCFVLVLILRTNFITSTLCYVDLFKESEL